MNYDGNHKYEVIFIDEYNNMYQVGFFDNLRDAEPQLNDYLKDYKAIDDEDNHLFVPQFGTDATLGELTEYSSTLSMCFDREIGVEEGCLQIRRFCY